MASSHESEDRLTIQEELDYPDKLSGYEFWKKTLKSARLVVAPMVDQSELAWRLLSRRYGAELCYTPMLHASIFSKDARYRKENLVTTPEDRPLIAQFCANDPDVFLKAAKLAEDSCDAIDLNLGCPQSIAKRGHYGAFLQDEWDLVFKMINKCHKHLKVPITCKMRVLDDVERTVRYAKTLEAAGCQLLAVHGRMREQKGINTGLADWTKIKAVREAVKIPVYANGNIQYLSDVEHCIQETGAEGVMSAEGNLHNPGLFAGGTYVAWDIANEYVDLYEQYPCPLSYIRGHLFKIFHHCLQVHLDLRVVLARAKLVPEFREVIRQIKEASKEDLEKYEQDPSTLKCDLLHPYWICQPYVRPKSDDPVNKALRESRKRPLEIPAVIKNNDEPLSKNKLKRMQRNPYKSFETNGRKYEQCEQCGNPKGVRCEFNLCKACCRPKCHKQEVDCPGHRLWFNRERRLQYEAEQKSKQPHPDKALCISPDLGDGGKPSITNGKEVVTPSNTDTLDNANVNSDTALKVSPLEPDITETTDLPDRESGVLYKVTKETGLTKVTDMTILDSVSQKSETES